MYFALSLSSFIYVLQFLNYVQINVKILSMMLKLPVCVARKMF